jgi:2'-5' RNA ligase
VRCFVALDLPDPVCNHLAQVTRPLRDRFDVKWVRAEHMHATLLFAGDVPGDVADELAELVHEIALPPLHLHLQDLGCFPPKGIPRVLWAGLHGDVEPLATLQEELTEQAVEIGIERDRRGFTPHVTIGRVKTEFGVLAMLDELRKLASQLRPKPFAASALTLYTSELRPSGPAYEVLTRRLCPVR